MHSAGRSESPCLSSDLNQSSKFRFKFCVSVLCIAIIFFILLDSDSQAVQDNWQNLDYVFVFFAFKVHLLINDLDLLV